MLPLAACASMDADARTSVRLTQLAWSDYQEHVGSYWSEGAEVTGFELSLGSVDLEEGQLDAPDLLSEFTVGVGSYEQNDALSLGGGARSYGSSYLGLRPFVSLHGILTLIETTPGIRNSGQYSIRPGLGLERYLADGWFVELLLDYDLVIHTAEKLFADSADPAREFEGWGLRVGLGYRF